MDKTSLKQLIRDIVFSEIDEVMEDAVRDAVCQFNYKPMITNVLADAVGMRLDDYIEGMVEDAVGDAVDEALAELFD